MSSLSRRSDRLRSKPELNHYDSSSSDEEIDHSSSSSVMAQQEAKQVKSEQGMDEKQNTVEDGLNEEQEEMEDNSIEEESVKEELDSAEEQIIAEEAMDEEHSIYDDEKSVYIESMDEDKDSDDNPVSNSEEEEAQTADDLDTKITFTLQHLQSCMTKRNVLRIIRMITRHKDLIIQFGLKKSHFKSLFHILNITPLSLSTLKQALSLLLPREQVPEKLIISIFGRLKKTAENVQAINEYLKWTISVYDYIDTTDTITKLYGVLFHYLAYQTTRNSLCHLLYFMTRKHHVTPYRINKLNELVQQERLNASLIGLLIVYRTFDPTIIVPVNVRIKDMFVFEHPDPMTKNHLKEIKTYWGYQSLPDGLVKPSIELPLLHKKAIKRKRIDAEVSLRPLRHGDIFDLFGQAKDLSYSQQLQKVLEDRQVQHLLVCSTDELIMSRLGYWIGHELLMAIRWNNSKDKGKAELKGLIQKLLTLTKFAKAQLPIINVFLKEYLKSWNGIEFAEEIFGLIQFIKPDDYQEIYHDILLPLYRKYYVMNVAWKAKLINCYTEWLKNWALLDWRGHKEQAHVQEVDKITCLFEGLSVSVNYFDTIQSLIEHVDKICVMGLLAEDDHPLLQHATLSFFELVATIPQQHDIPEIIVPSIDLVCKSFFSSNAMATSRMCGIIFRYINAFYNNDSKEEDWVSRHSPQYLEQFNTYVTDICTALWREKALTIAGNTTAFGLSQENIEAFSRICEEREEQPQSCFSLTQSGALAGFSKRFFKSLEKARKAQVTLEKAASAPSLQELEEQGGIGMNYFEYRVEYLNYLKRKGFTGISELLYSSMASLIHLTSSQSQ